MNLIFDSFGSSEPLGKCKILREAKRNVYIK